MKIKQLLPVFAAITLAIGFNSCKKADNSNSDEIETTFELSGDQAIADNLTQDANDVFNEVTTDNNLQGDGFAPSSGTTENIIPCATITITPAQGFPKTITIDFGLSCTHRGITRSGKIIVVLSDSVRRPGATAVMNFDNYYVNGYKKEGTITWTNTSTPGTKSWSRKCENGKITAPNGNYWLHSGMQYITQTAGVSTPRDITDDIFSITGNNSVTNSAGRTRTGTILEALQKKTACANIDKGKLKIEGPNHYAIIDFGNGDCDNLATISIDGRAPRTIILR
ncbi:MAG TPA: hypothetical protein PLZ45_06340 [Ferruginibacter sp.]|nr:hypothetical protein [Ferruginibacter sp.]